MSAVEKHLEKIRAELAGLRQEQADLQKDLREIKAKLSSRRRRRRRVNMPDWAPRFLAALAKTGRVEKAIALVGKPSSKRTYYKYRQNCRRFKMRWRAALEAYRRSVAKEPAAA